MSAVFSITLARAEHLFTPPSADPFRGQFRTVAGIDELIERLDDAPKSQRPGGEIGIVFEDGDLSADTAAKLIRGYCVAEAAEARRELRRTQRAGVLALWTGLPILAVCLSLSGLATSAWGTVGLGNLVSNGLVIAGWVAMWRPAELLLYAWRPFHRRARLLDALARMPVRVSRAPS